MKLLVIYANCHAYPIEFFLNLSDEFKNTYKCHIVSILNYLNKLETTQLNENDISNLKKADVVICQYIQNDRNYLNHSNILSYCKKDIKILMIPHHRFSVYSVIAKNEFKFKINNWTFIPVEVYNYYKKNKKLEDFKKGFDEIIKSITIKMEDDQMNKIIKYHIDQYTKLNSDQSTKELNMSSFVIDNYKNMQLFADDTHPTGIFFHELTKKILKLLRIYDVKKYDENNDYTKIADSIWLQTYTPILEQEKEKIGITFNCFAPYVVQLDIATRKKTNSLCEYYYYHIKNSLEKKFNSNI